MQEPEPRSRSRLRARFSDVTRVLYACGALWLVGGTVAAAGERHAIAAVLLLGGVVLAGYARWRGTDVSRLG